jgi:hypothetical protein
MSSRSSRFIAGISRIALTICVIIGLMAGTLGFATVPPAAMGGAFPCQGHGCGCHTADQCWFGCCCMTATQRLDWAKANGVTPPAGLLKLVRDDEKAKDRHVAACCAGHDHQAGDCGDHAAAAGHCCSKKIVAKSDAQAHSSDDVLPVIGPNRCHGPGQWWVTSGQPLGLPERPVTILTSLFPQPLLLSERDYSLDGQAPPTRPG